MRVNRILKADFWRVDEQSNSKRTGSRQGAHRVAAGRSLVIAPLVAALLAATLIIAGDASPAGATPLLWGKLKPGNYNVGYRVAYVFDTSRTWHTMAADAQSSFSPDTVGRPIRISIWYPTVANRRPMRVSDYLHNRAPDAFRLAEAALEKRDTNVISEWVPASKRNSLFCTPTAALRDAPPGRGRFPLVLYSAGTNAYTASNLVLAEFLASHGFVVATVPSLGPSDREPEQEGSAATIEASARDLEYAWSFLRRQPFVENAAFGVVGHSLGGLIAALIGMSNANVVAVVGLDASYGFRDTRGFMTSSYRYAPARMDAALLDIRRRDPGVDLSLPESFVYSDRYYISLSGMTHGDFTSFVAGAYAFHQSPPSNPPAGWTRELSFADYRLVCSTVLEFLEAKLRHDHAAADALSRSLDMIHKPAELIRKN